MQNKNIFKICFFYMLIITYILPNISCVSKYKKAVNSLPKIHRQFIVSVQYIISRKEKKIFVHLDDAQRDAFIVNFWKKRDPTPDTEENEYRDKYYRRIKEANKLFNSSGKNGWLSDRGRTYILFGPPDQREIYPTGYSFYEPPVEIWRYGMFPIVFIDKHDNGDYRITYPSLAYLQQIIKTEKALIPKYKTWDKSLEGKIKITKSNSKTILIDAKIPYNIIVFHKIKNNYLGVLILQVKIFNHKKEIKNIKKEIKIILNKEDIKKLPTEFNIRKNIKLPIDASLYKIEVKISDKTTDKGIIKKFNISNK